MLAKDAWCARGGWRCAQQYAGSLLTILQVTKLVAVMAMLTRCTLACCPERQAWCNSCSVLPNNLSCDRSWRRAGLVVDKHFDVIKKVSVLFSILHMVIHCSMRAISF